MSIKDKLSSISARIGRLIPDPVIIFVIFYIILLLMSLVFGGEKFTITDFSGNKSVYTFKYIFSGEGIRWIFSNAILNNWLAYGGGILGIILVVMLGIGVAEESGLLSVLIRYLGASVPASILPYVIIFIGIMSNIATDVGYLVLVPLAGLLYKSINKNPVVGMATAFAGVSAGFSANLIPATFPDVVIGTNAKIFALSQGIPFLSYLGKALTPATMNYYFLSASTLMLIIIGGLISVKITERKYKSAHIETTDDKFSAEVSNDERRALKFALLGFAISALIAAILWVFPLRAYIDADGNRVSPFTDNIILILTFIIFTAGAFYGIASKKFKKTSDLVSAMSRQMNNMGYVIVLTFFCYNFLALFSYTNANIFITGLGARFLQSIGLSSSPVLLILAVILITSLINLFVGGLTAKWMLLGPLLIPMLYNVNQSLTPDVVTAAYRVADSCTNTITPLMTYAGVVLMYMRKYDENMSQGDLISMMLPYSIIFLVSWSILLILFVTFNIPLGF